MAPEVWDGAKPNDFRGYFNISFLVRDIITEPTINDILKGAM
jgi:hypothetical protein